jgi:hypothetical protein
MSNPRRDFLGWLGATTVFASAGAPLAARETADASHAPLNPVDDKWDVSWVDRIQAKHRAVFDSPEISEGMGLYRTMMWRYQFKAVYGTEPKEMNPVLVIRHSAIPLAMNDAYWAKFQVGKEVKMKDPKTKKWYLRNPVRVTDPGTPPEWADASLEGLMGSGGLVLACNLAFQMVIHNFMQKEKLTHPDATKVAKEHLIPGVILQPSGVFAVLRAQQAGCGYIMAS